VTPETHAAHDRITAYLNARDTCTTERCHDDIIAMHAAKDSTLPAPALHTTDIRTLLTALDPAEPPITHVPTRKALNYLALRRQQHPRDPDQPEP